MAAPAESLSTIEAARAEVDRILQSKVFRASEVQRHLLKYLADKTLAGEGDSLKEYTIGLDALSKPATFDPRQESVVRMHTARLRQKLAEYYRTEGIDDPVTLDLPKGGFKLTFEPRAATVPPGSAAAPASLPAPPIPPRWRRRETLLAAGLALALAFGAFEAFRPARGAAPDAASWTPALRELWEPLLSSNRRLVVCIATPLFVRVPGFGVIRDSNVNEWEDVPTSSRLRTVDGELAQGTARGSAPEPSYSYTEVGTATGAFLLGQFLAPHRQNVLVTRANVMSWPEIAEDNVVFLGPPTGIHQAGYIPMDQQFVLDPAGVRNVKPKAGETVLMRDLPPPASGESALSYALISRIPAMNGPGAILMLSGNQVASVMGAVQAFTSASVAQMLVSHVKATSHTLPRYFQAVLSVKSMDDVPVEIQYVTHRELSQVPDPVPTQPDPVPTR